MRAPNSCGPSLLATKRDRRRANQWDRFFQFFVITILAVITTLFATTSHCLSIFVTDIPVLFDRHMLSHSTSQVRQCVPRKGTQSGHLYFISLWYWCSGDVLYICNYLNGQWAGDTTESESSINTARLISCVFSGTTTLPMFDTLWLAQLFVTCSDSGSSPSLHICVQSWMCIQSVCLLTLSLYNTLVGSVIIAKTMWIP